MNDPIGFNSIESDIRCKDLFGTTRPDCSLCWRKSEDLCDVIEECVAMTKVNEMPLIREQSKQIVSKLMYNNVVIDTIGNKKEKVAIDGVVLLEHGLVCPVYLKAENYFLRPLNMGDDGEVYISPWYVNKAHVFYKDDILNPDIRAKYNRMVGRYNESGNIVRLMLIV